MKPRTSLACLLVAAALFAPAVPRAEEVDAVGRLEEALGRPVAADTVLVFTNLASTAARVHLAAYDSEGVAAGQQDIEVAANGLAYVLASELVDSTEPRRFIGKVVSRGGGRLAASAVFVGGALTDVPTIVSYGRTVTRSGAPQPFTAATFPLVATY